MIFQPEVASGRMIFQPEVASGRMIFQPESCFLLLNPLSALGCLTVDESFDEIFLYTFLPPSRLIFKWF